MNKKRVLYLASGIPWQITSFTDLLERATLFVTITQTDQKK